jgi:hypothetical protein
MLQCLGIKRMCGAYLIYVYMFLLDLKLIGSGLNLKTNWISLPMGMSCFHLNKENIEISKV